MWTGCVERSRFMRLQNFFSLLFFFFTIVFQTESFLPQSRHEGHKRVDWKFKKKKFFFKESLLGAKVSQIIIFLVYNSTVFLFFENLIRRLVPKKAQSRTQLCIEVFPLCLPQKIIHCLLSFFCSSLFAFFIFSCKSFFFFFWWDILFVQLLRTVLGGRSSVLIAGSAPALQFSNSPIGHVGSSRPTRRLKEEEEDFVVQMWNAWMTTGTFDEPWPRAVWGQSARFVHIWEFLENFQNRVWVAGVWTERPPPVCYCTAESGHQMIRPSVSVASLYISALFSLLFVLYLPLWPQRVSVTRLLLVLVPERCSPLSDSEPLDAGLSCFRKKKKKKKNCTLSSSSLGPLEHFKT